MNREIKFTACKYLDFDDKFPDCKKDLVSVGNNRVVVFWDRGAHKQPSMVQFCKFGQRLNSCYACISKNTRRCDKYTEHQHTTMVQVSNG